MLNQLRYFFANRVNCLLIVFLTTISIGAVITSTFPHIDCYLNHVVSSDVNGQIVEGNFLEYWSRYCGDYLSIFMFLIIPIAFVYNISNIKEKDIRCDSKIVVTRNISIASVTCIFSFVLYVLQILFFAYFYKDYKPIYGYSLNGLLFSFIVSILLSVLAGVIAYCACIFGSLFKKRRIIFGMIFGVALFLVVNFLNNQLYYNCVFNCSLAKIICFDINMVKKFDFYLVYFFNLMFVLGISVALTFCFIFREKE